MDDWGWFIAFMLAMNSLTIAGVMVWLSLAWRIPIFVFWIVPPAAILLLNAYAYTLYSSFKERKFKKMVALALILPAVTLGPYSYVEVTKPNWSFAVMTDRSSYTVGANVQITVTLQNRAYLPQSITSSINCSLIVWVETFGDYFDIKVWYIPYQYGETKLSARSGESIIRTYIWNTTDIADPFRRDRLIERDLVTYRIWASLPQKGPLESVDPESDTPFRAWVNINVTAAQ